MDAVDITDSTFTYLLTYLHAYSFVSTNSRTFVLAYFTLISFFPLSLFPLSFRYMHAAEFLLRYELDKISAVPDRSRSAPYNSPSG